MPAAEYTHRPFADEADYARMRALVAATCALGGPPVYATAGDLDWWRCSDDDPDAIRLAELWFAGDDPIGIAWPADDWVDLIAHPHHRDAEAAMLAWAEARLLRRAPADGEPPTLRAWAYSGDAARTALLRGRGYTPGEGGLRLHEWRLDAPADPPPAPEMPRGYVARALAGAAEVEARAAAHRAAFGSTGYTAAKHRAILAAPTYRPDLDLVAAAPGGALAAFALAWYDPAARVGLFEPVGTDPGHRRRGLARALLHEGIRRLRALGARAAYVNSADDERPAVQLYPAAGFRLLDRNIVWRRTLTPE